jgi:hypothetical protein
MLALSDAAGEVPSLQDDVSAYLLAEPRILRDVCRSMQGDNDGRRCPTCCVREFCASQARRNGRLGDAAKASDPAVAMLELLA